MKHILSFLFLFIGINVLAQEKLVRDIDNDKINDTVYIDKEKSIIVCQLSTQNYKRIASKSLNINEHTHIKESENGFTYLVPNIRSGFSAQFKYDKKTKLIRLIKLKQYSLGNAVGDDSGELNLDLIHHNFQGNWNFFDYLANNEEGKLISMAIKTKMTFGLIYLENFDENTVKKFNNICYKEREKGRNNFLKKNKKTIK